MITFLYLFLSKYYSLGSMVSTGFKVVRWTIGGERAHVRVRMTHILEPWLWFIQ